MKRLPVRLAILGLIGTASLLLAPLERLVETDADPMTLRLLAVIQPAVLVVAAAFAGAWAAAKVGLDSPAVRAWADGRPVWPVLQSQLPSAIVAGAVVALVLIGFAAAIGRSGLGGELMKFEMPLVAKLLYGGIVEELLLRWGVMSLVVLAAARLARAAGPVPAWGYWAAASVAALLFAAGHLPTLYLLMPEPPSWLVALVLVGNAVPGLLFGWLYWRRGLEAAMIAHALAHLFSSIVLALR